MAHLTVSDLPTDHEAIMGDPISELELAAALERWRCANTRSKETMAAWTACITMGSLLIDTLTHQDAITSTAEARGLITLRRDSHMTPVRDAADAEEKALRDYSDVLFRLRRARGPASE
jgi:hypothetical protein